MTTTIVIAGRVLLWLAATVADRRSALFCALLLFACAAVYARLSRRRRFDATVDVRNDSRGPRYAQ